MSVTVIRAGKSVGKYKRYNLSKIKTSRICFLSECFPDGNVGPVLRPRAFSDIEPEMQVFIFERPESSPDTKNEF